jgi:hypothetical protein
MTDYLPPLPEFSSFADRNKAVDYALAAIAPYKKELDAVRMHGQATGIQWRAQYERAEKAEAENAKLRELLEQCRDYAYNPFEPGNQGNHYKRLDAALKGKP